MPAGGLVISDTSDTSLEGDSLEINGRSFPKPAGEKFTGVPLLMLWWWGVPALLDWYEDRCIVRRYLPIAQARFADRCIVRRYLPIAQARFAEKAAAPPPEMVVRGSFSRLVEAEQNVRA